MRYTGPKLKILRRLNLQKLPGLTRKTIKKNLNERPKKSSLFAIRLLEKQKLRYNFGLSNRQLLRYVKRAQKTPGSTGENLLKLLESRFDNIIFRLNLAPTINAARQLITHGHFQINKKKVTIPSYQCKINDEITIKNKSKNFLIKLIGNDNQNDFNTNKKKLPNYLLWDENRLMGTVCQEISLTDPVIQQFYEDLKIRVLFIIEYFARQL